MLLVGPDEEKFTIQQDVVTKARYFAGCLDSTLQGSHTKIIKLPGDELAVVAKVLEYLYSGKIEVATFKADIRSEEERLQYFLLAKMYIAADKFCMEAMQNMLMDVVKQTLLKRLADASANNPAPFADELLRTCITFGSTTESDFLSQTSDRIWHIHSDGRKCGGDTI